MSAFWFLILGLALSSFLPRAAFITLLAGEFDSVPFGVGVRCQALRALCAVQRRRPVAARVRPFRIRLANPPAAACSAS